MLVLGKEDNEEGIQFFREQGFSIFEDKESNNYLSKLSGWLEILDRL
jgi:hypothetical protein